MTKYPYQAVRFFCTRCGKEMKYYRDESYLAYFWDTFRKLKYPKLAECLQCSDCILSEIRSDKNGQKAD